MKNLRGHLIVSGVPIFMLSKHNPVDYYYRHCLFVLSRPVKTAYLSSRQALALWFTCMLQWHPIFRRPSSLRFVNKLDLIHCAKCILISSGSPKAGYHGPSPGLSGWRLRGATHKLLGFSCWRCYFPFRSRAVTQNGLLVWQGVKGSRLHLPVEGKLEWFEGKWGLMENTENRNERNPLPVSLLASSNSFFSLYIFYSSTIVCHVGLRLVGQVKLPGLFVVDFVISLTETGDLFLYVEREEKWKTRCHYTQMHEDTLRWFCQLSGIKQKCFSLRPRGHRHPNVSQLPLNAVSEHSSFLPSVVHFDLEKTTSLAQWILLFFFTPCRSLPYPPTLVPSSFCALPCHYCASRQKGPWCLWTREERWSSIIDKSHLRGGQWPHFFFCRIHLQSFQTLQISCRPPCRYSDDLVKQ